MTIGRSTTLAVLFACAAAACVPAGNTARRSSTAIRTDPRPPEDTNMIPPPVPEPESVAPIRR
jgi:hypothetical protein